MSAPLDLRSQAQEKATAKQREVMRINKKLSDLLGDREFREVLRYWLFNRGGFMRAEQDGETQRNRQEFAAQLFDDCRRANAQAAALLVAEELTE